MYQKQWWHYGFATGGPSTNQGVQLAVTTVHTYCRHIAVAENGGATL
jgi:hypothetical protein